MKESPSRSLIGLKNCIVAVNWHQPLLGWVKVNTKYRGVFRDFRGSVLGAFCSSYDIPSSVATEVMTVIKAIELDWVQDENISS